MWRWNDLLPMIAWRWRGWIILLVLAAAFYPIFGRGSDAAPFYAEAGRCILRGEAILPCMPTFSYQPALAALFVPFSFVPAALQRPVWYVICVSSLVLTVRLTEAMAGRLYPGATRGKNLIWLRGISLTMCAKHIIDVLTYASHDPPALAIITFGIWALFVGRDAIGGLWFGMAAAVRATPLIFLPYLLLKRRYVACLIFVAAFLAVSFFPDILGTLRGGHTGYLGDWLRDVVGPEMVPATSSKLVFWDNWNGINLLNQSLRGMINRFVSGPAFGLSPTMILIAVDGAFALVVAALLLSSPGKKEYVAIDGAVLLIAILALSPMTSRYHYLFVLPPVILLCAAALTDARIRVLANFVLWVSFLLRAGTSNDVVGQRVTDFAYMYGFMPLGAIVLYIGFAAILWVWRPPGIPEGEIDTPEPTSAD